MGAKTKTKSRAKTKKIRVQQIPKATKKKKPKQQKFLERLPKLTKKLNRPQRALLAYKRRLKIFSLDSFRIKQLLYNVKSSCGRSYGRISVRHKRSSSFLKRLIFNLSSSIFRYKLVAYSYFYKLSRIGIAISSANTMQYTSIPFFSSIGHNIYSVFRPRHTFHKIVRKQTGSTFILKYIATGSKVCNIELRPNKGPVFVRSPGCFGTVLTKKRFRKKEYAGILLPSSQIIYVDINCSVMFGRKSVLKGKYKTAGFMHNHGTRPKVRGVAMNPIDHPHGGGEGKRSNPPTPIHPWGTQNKWKKTLSKYTLQQRENFIYKMKRLTVNLL